MTLKTTTSAGGEAVTPSEGDPAEQDQKTTSEVAEKPEAQSDPGAEDGQPGEPSAENEGDEDGKKRNRVSENERIKQITARRRMAERERDRAVTRAEAAEQEVANLRRRLQDPNITDAEEQRLRLEETLSRREARQARAVAGESEVEAHNERVETFKELAATDKRFPNLLGDFGRVPVTDYMARFIMRSDDPVAMANWMAAKGNRDEVDELIELTTPNRRGRVSPEDIEEAVERLADVRAQLRAKPAARTTTNAPDPGRTLNGGPPPAGKQSLQELAKNEDASAYIKQRQAEMAARQR